VCRSDLQSLHFRVWQLGCADAHTGHVHSMRPVLEVSGYQHCSAGSRSCSQSAASSVTGGCPAGL
jgi:hypothetical protein